MANQEMVMKGFLPTLRFYKAEMEGMVGTEGLLGGMGLMEKRG